MNPLVRLARWVAFTVAFITIALSIQLTQYPILLLLPFSMGAFRKAVRLTMEAWASEIVFITKYFAPTKLIVSGEADKLRGENYIIMTNHQTFLDWWYLWILAYNRGLSGSLKIILKKSLQWIPFYGWGMHWFEFIFLARSWEQDRAKMGRYFKAYREPTSKPFWLVVFPEGTIIRPESRKKSDQFAEKIGIKPYDHMLVPRTTGLYYCFSQLDSTITHIVDITIAYQGTKANQYPSLVYKLRSVFLDGRSPPAIHMHVRRFAVADIPKEEEAFIKWTQERFREKDALLDRFYRTGALADERRIEEVHVGALGVVRMVVPFVIHALVYFAYRHFVSAQ